MVPAAITTWWGHVVGVVATTALLVTLTSAQPRVEPGPLFFEQQVQPMLRQHCLKCHGNDPERIRAGLRLNSRLGLTRGGDRGSVIDFDRPEHSLLLEMVSYRDEHHQMPPAGRLSDAEIDTLTRWVKMGIPWAAEGPRPEPAKEEAEPTLTDGSDYWAYQPVEEPTIPEVENEAWVRNPIDAFILARLEKAELEPAEPAEKTALLRRATYDLTGLPPSPEEVDAFIADTRPDAYERRIDTLLASPHYGEKWGRHWLDLVRYAETNGYERDSDKPYMWRYRDYVINAFNQDKPYDRFIVEQLAGDELDKVTPETLTATGFYRLGLWDDEVPDRLQSRYDTLDDIVSTTSQVFLGVSLGCARCHDHRKDPFLQKDYYSVLAFFDNISDMSKRGILRPVMSAEEHSVYEEKRRAKEASEQKLEERLRQIEIRFREKLAQEDEAFARQMASSAGTEKKPKGLRDLLESRGPDVLSKTELQEYRDLKKGLKLSRQRVVPGTFAPAIAERGSKAPQAHVLIRGNAHVKGEAVQPAFPAVLDERAPALPQADPSAKTTGRRRVLAEWIASKENKSTARVMANRLWQYHFGRGIVRSSNDFGRLGTQPTHPKLLDWLATEFVRQGWRMKAMHKLMMLSSTYRMSCQAQPQALAVDPQNDLFWRFNMRRLGAEEIRDSILAVNGRLNLKIGGPSVFPPMPAEVLATSSRPDAVWGKSTPAEAARRSVYIKVKRSLILPMLANFDLADTDASCPVRFATTQPSQALGMLNSAFINEEAAHFVDRLHRDAGMDTTAQLERALRLALARKARPEEISQCASFVSSLQSEQGQTAAEALTNFCLMVYNLNEFVFLD